MSAAPRRRRRRGRGKSGFTKPWPPEGRISWTQFEGEMDWNVMIGVEGRWMSSHHWPMLKKNCHMKYDLPLTWCVLGKAS